MSRPERVAERIKMELAEIFIRELNDPRIGFITITKVDVSPDLEDAKIYVSVFGSDEEKLETMKGLESAKKFIRGKLGGKLELRGVPEIQFILDESIEKASKVWSLMNKIHDSDS